MVVKDIYMVQSVVYPQISEVYDSYYTSKEKGSPLNRHDTAQLSAE